MCFNQDGAIFSLKKLIDQFTYLGSNISSTKSYVSICIDTVHTAVNRLSTIWKSDLHDKISREFFQMVAVSVLLYSCTILDFDKSFKKKLDGNYTRAVLNKSRKQHYKTAAVRHIPSISRTIQVQEMLGIAEEVRTST